MLSKVAIAIEETTSNQETAASSLLSFASPPRDSMASSSTTTTTTTTTAVVVTPVRNQEVPSMISSPTAHHNQNKMETALDVLQRALQGDAGARSFLDQTSKLYVLDATSPTIPKLFGAWNFLHQSLNEVERMESAVVLSGENAACQQLLQAQSQLLLQAQSQLLATFAAQVARRSHAQDQALVQTCIDNYRSLHNNSSSSRGNDGDDTTPANHPPPMNLQHLITDNTKLREIVMGRIAAHAFDQNGSSTKSWIQVVACNAISNKDVQHLLCDWIIPSRESLDSKSLAILVADIATEATRPTCPAGTQESLQQLSAACLQQVLSKILLEKDVVLGSIGSAGGCSKANNEITALSIKALKSWLTATDLSLAQAQHLCAKVQINLVEVLSDAMYSDDPKVVDAIADLLEFVVQQHPPRDGDDGMDGVSSSSQHQPRPDSFYITPARFQQTRYIMGVPDEASFKANITAQQLYAIESKELGSMLEELASAIALQRFRFVSHASQSQQQQSNTKVCLNLARICVAICQGYEKIVVGGAAAASGQTTTATTTALIPSPGCLDLLTKCAGHPSVEICAMALPVITPLLKTEVGLATQWLPILQRRAIVPHEYVEGATVPSLSSSSIEFQDFCHQFRDTVLADGLIASYNSHSEYYLASCTAAIEEFCGSGDSNDEKSEKVQQQTSFHLEAALFCMAVVAEEALSGMANANPTVTSSNTSTSNKISEFLERCTAALAKKPKSLSNPLTLQQSCHFIRKYDKFFSANEPAGVLDVAAELSLFIFTQCATDYPNESLSIAIRNECGVTPYAEAAKTLDTLLCHNPTHFLSNKAIAALGAGWEATFTACNRSGELLSNDDRMAICKGICHVLAALPESQRATSLMALAMPLLGCLESMLQRAESAVQDEKLLNSLLERAASEIVVLTALCRAYTDAASTDSSRERTSDTHAALAEPALEMLRRAWSQIAQAASRWSFHGSILEALGFFLAECIPPECNDDMSLSLLGELCTVAQSIIDSPYAKSNELFFRPVFEVLIQCVKVYGNTLNKTARSIQDGRSTPSVGDRDKEVTKLVKFLIIHTLEAMDDCLGISWATAQQQGNGQPAFEIKTRPLAVAESSSLAGVTKVGLPSLFELFQLIAERCPYVLLQLRHTNDANVNMDENNPSVAPGSHSLDLLLLRRTLDSAVSSLLDPQGEISLSSVQILQSILSHCDASSSSMVVEANGADAEHQHSQNSIVEEFRSRIQPSIVCTLMIGCACGKLERSSLVEGCRLLQGTIPSVVSAMDDFEALVLHGAGGVGGGLSEHFCLGDDALRTLMAQCNRILSSGNANVGGNRNAAESSEFLGMMGDLWDLHQSETPEALAGSDAVQIFVRKYQQR